MTKKILVVDDERHIVHRIKEGLERDGYEVVTAFDGVEALKKVKSESPDMIIIDTMMPRMDGHQTIVRLRSSPETENTPVITLSNKGDVDRQFVRRLLDLVMLLFDKLESDETTPVTVEVAPATTHKD